MVTRRRVVVALGAGALAAPLALFAQQPPKIQKIGYLGRRSASGVASGVEAFRASLRDLGYVEGKNIVIEYRWAEGNYDRLPALAADLVQQQVSVIYAPSTPLAQAAKQASGTIAIVFSNVGDPVGIGLVASLARPGGNITGISIVSPEIYGKRIELLKDIFPRIRQIAVLLNPDNAGSGPVLKGTAFVANALKLELQPFYVRGPKEIVDAFSAMAKRHVDAVTIHNDLTTNYGKAIADLAAKQRIPSIGPTVFAVAGGLIGFGVNDLEQHRRAAYFVDRILKGTKPSDLPVEQPMTFELVLNMKTANALGIKIPNSVLVRATKVIE